MVVSANEIKMKGVSLLSKLLKKADEVFISVRGKKRFVVLDIERYERFRANELDLAYLQVQNDIKEGEYKRQSAADHIKEIADAL